MQSKGFILAFISLLSIILSPPVLFTQTKLQLNIDRTSDYLCYYGSWDDDKLFRGKDFDMIILEPSNISSENILKLRSGHDNIIGTSDDVIVIGYISVGEDHSNSRTGNGKGPCYYDYNSSKIIYENKGLASWYVDDKDKNGLPDADPVWKSAYVNAGDTLWWEFLKTNSNGADVILYTKGCDGLFLDLLDTASPWYPWPYRWTLKGMSDLVKWLKETYPEKYLIGNRGLFYFDPAIPEAYAHNIRPYIDGIMFESYFIETDRKGWAQKLNKEAQKTDGFKVIALDYLDYVNPAQISQQVNEVSSYNWTNLISVVTLDKIIYEVFHRHVPDKNPPTWNGSAGLKAATAGDQYVTLYWGDLTDNSKPLKYNLYYTKDTDFSFESAVMLSDIIPDFDSASAVYSFTVNGLTNYSVYNFVLRVSDSAGNSEHNVNVISATPPHAGQGLFLIDGSFNDWLTVEKLNKPPNPAAATGSSQNQSADYINFWCANDSTNLYISYQTAGSLSASLYYHIFIDTDFNKCTGYIMNDSSAIGAEIMVEGGYCYKYTGSGGTNWSWSPVNNFEIQRSISRAELKIPLSNLTGLSSSQQIRMFFNVNNANPPYNSLEVEPQDYRNEYYSYKLSSATDVKDKITADQFHLFQNYPNPFNSGTVISFIVNEYSHVRVDIINSLGQKVTELADEYMNKGYYSFPFSSDDISSGIYFYRLIYIGQIFTKKMLVLK